jgi:predicted AAA+ superfamily ATPase
MIPRLFSKRLSELLRRFPIVSVLGPRQCGKTTFIRSALPRWRYLDIERPSDNVQIAGDPEAAFREFKTHFILDEAQELPSLFPVLRSHVDQHRRLKGQVVLLGSASPELIGHISESLAGRVGFLEMTPFQWAELAPRRSLKLDDFWLRGGFPDNALVANAAARSDWSEGYTRTFIERDLSALGIDVSSAQMRKLWTMLAHFNGQIWNASQLASSLGTSYHTVNRYTDILEQTFLVRKLMPYYSNIGKRIVKSPKIYMRDTGLLHFFLNIRDQKTLRVSPARGASWEGFVIEQAIAALQQALPQVQVFYWRTAAGAEVDLLVSIKNEWIPFEIKLHSSPTRDMLHGLKACMNDLKLKRGYVLYPGARAYPLGDRITALPTEPFLRDPLTMLAATFYGPGTDLISS